MAEGGGGGGPAEQEKRSSMPRPPSARDLQLALAELYEDEMKSKSSKTDRPKATIFKSPRTPPQRFYSSEREFGGLHIVRPSPGKIVNELFKEAREHGAVPLNEASRASGDEKSKSFSGGGYRLGSSFCKRSEYIYGENQLQDVQVLLKLWSNGFSLDDGELRPYSDPTNAQFLESVKRGLTPEIVSTPSSPEEEDKSIVNAVVLTDDSVPTTKVQIRLADGSRLIQRFNHTHRILDVREFIIQSRPEFATLDFILVTSFPNKVLTDESLTLQEADVLNTVILQQLK
ncbi:UBX domain-containing protein 2B isoform 2-T2 [Rhynchocyon petersi]